MHPTDLTKTELDILMHRLECDGLAEVVAEELNLPLVNVMAMAEHMAEHIAKTGRLIMMPNEVEKAILEDAVAGSTWIAGLMGDDASPQKIAAHTAAGNTLALKIAWVTHNPPQNFPEC